MMYGRMSGGARRLTVITSAGITQAEYRFSHPISSEEVWSFFRIMMHVVVEAGALNGFFTEGGSTRRHPAESLRSFLDLIKSQIGSTKVIMVFFLASFSVLLEAKQSSQDQLILPICKMFSQLNKADRLVRVTDFNLGVTELLNY